MECTLVNLRVMVRGTHPTIMGVVRGTHPTSRNGPYIRYADHSPTIVVHGVHPTFRLQKLTKLLDCKSSVTNDTAKREGVNWVVPRDSKDACTVRHDDVLALTHNAETGFPEGTHNIEMIDVRDFRQGSRPLPRLHKLSRREAVPRRQQDTR